MSINTLLLCARCIEQTGHAKKTEHQGISGTVVVACNFSGKHAPFFVFFTCVYLSEGVRITCN